jgi:hypothetical protein
LKRVEGYPFDPSVATFWSVPTFEEWRDWMVAQDQAWRWAAVFAQLAKEVQ